VLLPVELLRPPLHLQLAARDIRRSFPERSFQLLDLGERFGALAAMLLRQPACELEHLCPVWVFLGRLPLDLPTG